MSRIIIGIHGLGNKPPEKILKKWWKKSIKEGLKVIDHPRLFLKFELVYWAHFHHPKPLNPKEKNEKDPLHLDDPYIPMKYFTPKKPSKLRKKILDYLEKQLHKIFLNDDGSINFASITDLIIHRYFRDLDFYYSATYPGETKTEYPAKEVIREKLARILEKHRGKHILLIAHSMGSIIAYDVLTQTVPDITIDTFVTIGSPLGLPLVMSKILLEQNKTVKKGTRAKRPKNVLKNWYNFSDLEDKVALDHSLADDYEESSSHVQVIDKVVYNNYEHDGKRNPHKSYGYLRTPELAEVIHDFLNQGKNKAIIRITDKLNRLLTKKIKRVNKLNQ